MARTPCLLTFFLLAAAAVLTWAPGGALGKSKLAKKSDDIVNGPLLTEKIKAKKTLIVGPDEELKTVQSAIDAVPAGNAEWIIVHLRSGLHRHACMPTTCLATFACSSLSLFISPFILMMMTMISNDHAWMVDAGAKL
jgi:microcompartment protein CcmK/EutM